MAAISLIDTFTDERIDTIPDVHDDVIQLLAHTEPDEAMGDYSRNPFAVLTYEPDNLPA